MATVDAMRAQFPALESGFVYLENAGGSQLPRCVIDAMSTYMAERYVQLGAGYPASMEATKTVADAHAFANRYVNGEGRGFCVIGPSTTQLCAMLAECYRLKLRPGDEVVICETAHEANAGPWTRLERDGIVVKTWKLDPDACFDASRPCCPIDNLREVLSERTRIVAFPHVSNLLGEIVDVTEITKAAHDVGARVVVDGVAFAPHRAIDVAAWDVDFYVYSAYKVFGPHTAVMFGKDEAWAELEGPNHFFLPRDAYKFELGGANHEGCAGLLALQEYLALAADASGASSISRDVIERAWTRMSSLERPLEDRLIRYLRDKASVRIVGPVEGPDRVPTVSFLHASLRPSEIVAAVDGAGIGIRYGHMYAYRLCEALGIDPESGVVRVSAVHYNTLEEIERLIEVLDAVL